MRAVFTPQRNGEDICPCWSNEKTVTNIRTFALLVYTVSSLCLIFYRNTLVICLCKTGWPFHCSQTIKVGHVVYRMLDGSKLSTNRDRSRFRQWSPSDKSEKILDCSSLIVTILNDIVIFLFRTGWLLVLQ